MKAREFIEEYLSSGDDNIVYLHSPDFCSSEMFSINEWRESEERPILSEIVYEHLECEVSGIRAKVENYNYNLAVVIHIYTDYPYEEAK